MFIYVLILLSLFPLGHLQNGQKNELFQLRNTLDKYNSVHGNFSSIPACKNCSITFQQWTEASVQLLEQFKNFLQELQNLTDDKLTLKPIFDNITAEFQSNLPWPSMHLNLCGIPDSTGYKTILAASELIVERFLKTLGTDVGYYGECDKKYGLKSYYTGYENKSLCLCQAEYVVIAAVNLPTDCKFLKTIDSYYNTSAYRNWYVRTDYGMMNATDGRNTTYQLQTYYTAGISTETMGILTNKSSNAAGIIVNDIKVTQENSSYPLSSSVPQPSAYTTPRYNTSSSRGTTAADTSLSATIVTRYPSTTVSQTQNTSNSKQNDTQTIAFNVISAITASLQTINTTTSPVSGTSATTARSDKLDAGAGNNSNTSPTHNTWTVSNDSRVSITAAVANSDGKMNNSNQSPLPITTYQSTEDPTAATLNNSVVETIDLTKYFIYYVTLPTFAGLLLVIILCWLCIQLAP